MAMIGLGMRRHENLQVEHVEAPDARLAHRVVADVAVVTPDLLVAARAEAWAPGRTR